LLTRPIYSGSNSPSKKQLANPTTGIADENVQIHDKYSSNND